MDSTELALKADRGAAPRLLGQVLTEHSSPLQHLYLCNRSHDQAHPKGFYLDVLICERGGRGRRSPEFARLMDHRAYAERDDMTHLSSRPLLSAP